MQSLQSLQLQLLQSAHQTCREGPEKRLSESAKPNAGDGEVKLNTKRTADIGWGECQNHPISAVVDGDWSVLVVT